MDQPTDIQPAEKPQRSALFNAFKWTIETVLLVVAAYFIAMGFRAAIAQAYEIPTPSMEPTILVQDRVFAERVSLWVRDPEPGDVVVFDDPNGGPIPLVKRVIATGNQVVAIAEGAVWVDGEKIDEPYTMGEPTELGTVSVPMVVPHGHVWVMGDNRANSSDSRYFGAVPISSIEARALAVYWPLDHIGGLEGGK